LNRKREDENSELLKLSNIYFHLKKLVDFGHVREIAIKKGRYRVKYYSRTAKVFIFSTLEPNQIEELKEQYLPNYSKFLHKFAPKYTEEQIHSILDRLFDYRITNVKKLISWLEKYHDLLEEFDINPGMFFQVMTELIGSDLSDRYLGLLLLKQYLLVHL
jgi:DNA-binding transcriptional regulator GbsR (MarR family)